MELSYTASSMAMLRDRDDEILNRQRTEEAMVRAVVPDKTALFALRAVAYLVDFFAFAAPIMYSHNRFHIPTDDMYAFGLMAVSFFVLLGIFESRLGATPGKLLARLRVIDSTGRYPS